MKRSSSKKTDLLKTDCKLITIPLRADFSQFVSTLSLSADKEKEVISSKGKKITPNLSFLIQLAL